MSRFRATIYRTSANCGISSGWQSSVPKAIREAQRKAGRLFILGLSSDSVNENRFGYDATQFVDEAALHCIANMRRRKNKPVLFTVTDSRKDVSLEVAREMVSIIDLPNRPI